MSTKRTRTSAPSLFAPPPHAPPRLRRYELLILLEGEQIQGSPFRVTVRAAAAAAERCVASGDGLHAARAGARTSFVVQAVDSRGELKLCGGDSFVASFHGPVEADHPPEDDKAGAARNEWAAQVIQRNARARLVQKNSFSRVVRQRTRIRNIRTRAVRRTATTETCERLARRVRRIVASVAVVVTVCSSFAPTETVVVIACTSCVPPLVSHSTW